MGYQITLKPTEEKMNVYKPWKEENGDDEHNIKNAIREIVSICMRDNSGKSTSVLLSELTFALRYLKACVEINEKHSAYNRWKADKDGELWYCGWEFSHESEIGADDLIENALDELFLFADVVKCNFFDNEDNFWEKRRHVHEQLEGFVESMSDVVIHGIVDELREFELKYDDEDNVADENNYDATEADAEYDDSEIDGEED